MKNVKGVSDCPDDYRTLCCESNFVRVGRASYKCKKCKKDVSVEVLLFFSMIYG